MGRRTLVIGLDAFEPTVAAALMAEGRMPNLARLASRSARFDLDHGPERYTGLAWHQFSTGLRPQESGRWSAVTFDPATYRADQPDADESPFTAGLGLRTLVFDVPRFNMAGDPDSFGVANWGSHDAGVPRATRPAELWDEMEARFGPYPAPEHIYDIVWRNADKTRDMGEALVAAVAKRRAIALWLLGERLPDWDLAIVSLSEFHSVVETMWHGWDETHPLHDAPSAPGARKALIDVYAAADGMIGALADAFPDAAIVAFAPHGMGANKADAAGMAWMAELMFRYSFGVPAFVGADFPGRPDHEDWSDWVNCRLYFPEMQVRRRRSLRAVVRTWLRPPAPPSQELAWMPAARYAPYWPRMRAFALPAYHDARIRLNVAGREAAGVIDPGAYDHTCAEVEAVVGACVDVATGAPLDMVIDFPLAGTPMRANETQADVLVRLNRNVLGVRHPDLGLIGPLPHRRTGGHTGGYGIAYVSFPGIAAGTKGVTSTFDMPHAVIDIVTSRPPISHIPATVRPRLPETATP